MSNHNSDIHSNKQLREELERSFLERVQEQRDRNYDWDLIVSTCHEVIRDCPDPFVRWEAARLMHRLCSQADLSIAK